MPRKIIYFDRETIKNILQEKNKGTRVKTSGTARQASTSVTTDAEASSNIYLGVPVLARIKFVFTGALQMRIDDSTYIRFNNTAFVSNYKRNDLLTTKITSYCVPVGQFIVDDFNFIKQLTKMQNMLTSVNASQSIADVYPSDSPHREASVPEDRSGTNNKPIALYDVVYACIAED